MTSISFYKFSRRGILMEIGLSDADAAVIIDSSSRGLFCKGRNRSNYAN